MTIKEVSEKYDLSADTIRYYERSGLIPHVPRKENGIRDFDEAACGWVEFSKCMRNAGVQVEALIEYVDLFFKEGTEEARKDILVEQRARPAESQALCTFSCDQQINKGNIKHELEHKRNIIGARAPSSGQIHQNDFHDVFRRENNVGNHFCQINNGIGHCKPDQLADKLRRVEHFR